MDDVESVGFKIDQSGTERMMEPMGTLPDDRFLFRADQNFKEPGYWVWDFDQVKHLRAHIAIGGEDDTILVPMAREVMESLSQMKWSGLVRLRVGGEPQRIEVLETGQVTEGD